MSWSLTERRLCAYYWDGASLCRRSRTPEGISVLQPAGKSRLMRAAAEDNDTMSVFARAGVESCRARRKP
jgi:hypothetical protein